MFPMWPTAISKKLAVTVVFNTGSPVNNHRRCRFMPPTPARTPFPKGRDGRMEDGPFLYFAYGSNMLARRIRTNNPTAVRHGLGKLQGYRLDFNRYSDYWDGCPATVVPDAVVDAHVWGVLWTLNASDLEHLDRQEGVADGIYAPIAADVVTADGGTVSCRSYVLVDQPDKQVPLPLARRPSKAYLNTILLGARESRLPLDYFKTLQEIPDNGKDGPAVPWLTS